MSQQQTPKNVELSIKKIGVRNFQITQAGQSITFLRDDNTYEFKISLKMIPNLEKRFMNVVLNLSLSDIITKVEYCSMETFMDFWVKNIDEISFKGSDNRMLVYNDVMPIFASIIIGTTRGLFASYVANTGFNNAIIPVIDATKFIPLNPEEVPNQKSI